MSSLPRGMGPGDRPRLRAHARLQWDPVRKKQIILLPESVLVLNETAAAVLALCDGQRRVSDIVATLAEHYNRPVVQDVLTFLNRLANKDVLDVVEEHED